MKIADYGKAITSYIESPTTAQKLKSKESAQNLLAEVDFSGMTGPQLRILYERYTGVGAPKDPKELIIELKRLMKNLDQDGVPLATGGRVHLADGSEDIVEPSESMKVDTTTKGPDLFTLQDFKDKAEIYVLALHNRALPLDNIKSALNKFTKQGLNDGTFTIDEAIKVVQNLKFEAQDRAQKQRLRDVIIAGTGTVKREDFSEGSTTFFQDLEKLEVIKNDLSKKYPGVQVAIDKTGVTPKIRLNTQPVYKDLVEDIPKLFSVKEIEKVEDAASKMSTIIKPLRDETLSKKGKLARQNIVKQGIYGDKQKVIKQVNKIIEEVNSGKRPLMDVQKLLRGELVDTQLASKNFTTVDYRTGKPFYLTEKNYKIYKEKIYPKFNSVKTRIRNAKASEEILDGLNNLTLKNFNKFYKKNPPFTAIVDVPNTIGGKISDILNRHSLLGGDKFKTISGKSFRDFKIKDLNTNEILTTEKIDKLISQNDPRFREFVKIKKQVDNLKKTKITNPVTKKPMTLFKALQESTGDLFPVHIDHIKGVKEEPLRFFQTLLSKTNIGKDAATTVDELKQIGARRVLPGKEYAQGAVIDFEKQVDDLKKFATRKILQTEASGFEKPKTPRQLIGDKLKTGLVKGLKTTGKVIKPLGYAFGANALKTAVTKAEEQGLELNLMDKIMAFDSGDAEVALNNAKRRIDPEFAAAEKAKDLAKMTDDFEEVGQSPFGKYNDQIKNIKLP